MPWRIDYEGEVYREDDLTLEQQEAIVDLLTGRGWTPHPATSPKAFRVILAHCIAANKGIDVDVAMKEIATLRTGDAYKMVSNEDDDTPTEYVDGNPQPADEPSITS